MALTEIPVALAAPTINELTERRNAYWWASDFQHGVVACVLAAHGLRTWGEIADLTATILVTWGLTNDEVGLIKRVLDKRKLRLATIAAVPLEK